MSTTAGSDRYLEPYRLKMRDERRYELTRALLDWCAPQCTCLERIKPHVRHVVQAGAFAYFCAPSDTTADESLALAKDVLIFFLADDGPALELKELGAYLDGCAPAGIGELTTWYRTLISDMQAAGLRVTDYDRAIADMCAGMARERQVNPFQLRVPEFMAIRRRAFAVFPYVACWIALRHRHLEGIASRVWSELGLFPLAIDAMIMVNDVASVQRDITSRSLHATPAYNYVLIRHPGLSTLDARIEAAIDLANRRIAQIEHRFALVEEAAAMHEPRLIEFATFVVSLVNGNLDATVHLTDRYSGVERLRIRRLEYAAPPALDAALRGAWPSS